MDVSDVALEKMKDFVKEQGKVIGISSDKRASVMAFGTTPQTYLPINDGTSLARMQRAVDKVTNTGESRVISEAVKALKGSIAAVGSKGNVGRVGVVFIAGKISQFDLTRLQSETAALQRYGMELFFIAVGSKVKDQEIASIARKKGNLAHVSSVDQLADAMSDLSAAIKNSEKVSEELDLGIVIGVDRENADSDFRLGKQLLIELLDKLDVSSTKIRLGLILYGASARTILRLDRTLSKDQIKREIEALSTPQPGSTLAQALDISRNDLFLERNGARRGVPKTALILSNSFDDPRSKDAAESLRKQGIRVVATVLGDNDRVKLIGDIASAYKGTVRLAKDDDIPTAVNTLSVAILPGM